MSRGLNESTLCIEVSGSFGITHWRQAGSTSGAHPRVTPVCIQVGVLSVASEGDREVSKEMGKGLV